MGRQHQIRVARFVPRAIWPHRRYIDLPNANCSSPPRLHPFEPRSLGDECARSRNVVYEATIRFPASILRSTKYFVCFVKRARLSYTRNSQAKIGHHMFNHRDKLHFESDIHTSHFYLKIITWNIWHEPIKSWLKKMSNFLLEDLYHISLRIEDSRVPQFRIPAIKEKIEMIGLK